ncbi:MAG TPA: CHAT domain-containing tetratricopeptide repeat protein [Silvibacterium sp.]|nr:CHAT domain-containing tetratricopeptide repeat protein [Silvibacterium sp.]
MKFRLLEAEILTYQGRRPDVLALLDSHSVSFPATGDLAIKRDLLLGLAHAGLGQTQQSDRELREARILSDASNSVLNGEVLQAEAKIQLSRNYLPEATDLYQESLRAAQEHGQSFLEISDLLNLGYVALEMEHYDEAVALFNKTASFASPIQVRPAIEAAQGNAGVAYFYLGDYEKALSSFQQAEQEAKEIGITSGQVDWLWDEGRAYFKLGNPEEAERCFEESLKAATAIHAPDEIAGINTQLGFLFYQQGRYDAAKTYSDAAMQAAHQSGDKSVEAEPRFLQALLVTRQPNAQDAEQLLLQLRRDTADSPSLSMEIEDTLANFYAGRQQPQQAEQWYLKSISTFETQRSSVSDEELKLPFYANGDSLYRDYADFLIASQKPDHALQLLDLGRARTLEEGLDPAKKNPRDLQDQALNPQAIARKLRGVILFYSLGPEKSHLWAVNTNSTRLFTLPKQADIDARVQRYQKSILRSSDPLREINEDGRSLYDILIAPAASMIPRDSRVFIIPNGSLNRLNFETLLTPGTDVPHYWIENVTVTNANSIRMLSKLSDNSNEDSEKGLLLIGNPVATSTEYENLPNAAAEISDIEAHFPPDRRTVFTQGDAVPAAYAASHPDRFSYIHFVAHGTASRLSPLDSAVILSATPQHPDRFKLYARDIVHYPLHARLVIISACYGSGLRAYAGEGLVGLSWAFLRAGSHNVIGALWEVNDASTPVLMDRLYAGLQSGMGPDEALRTAKLSLIHSGNIYRKPLYWAAFQLYSGS